MNNFRGRPRRNPIKGYEYTLSNTSVLVCYAIISSVERFHFVVKQNYIMQLCIEQLGMLYYFLS